MKKYLFILLFVFSGVRVYSQVECEVSYAVELNSVWGAWSQTYRDYYYGSFREFVHIGERRHPSEYIWKLELKDYVHPTKSEIKKHYKNKEWWTYEGILEFFVTDEYPDAVSQLKKNGDLFVAPWLHDVSKGQTPCVKKTIPVEVKIAPYKDYPHCYNIHFRNLNNVWVTGVGMAISFKTNPLTW